MIYINIQMPKYSAPKVTYSDPKVTEHTYKSPNFN